MSKGPAEKLEGAAHAISTAAMLLRKEEPTIKDFLKECRDMENFGHVLDPTLYNKSERRAVSALMEPLFKAAVDFLTAYDIHLSQARAALDKVSMAVKP
jgi:hypothetical protein